MDAPVPVHLKEMYKEIRHVLSTKRYGLKFDKEGYHKMGTQSTK